MSGKDKIHPKEIESLAGKIDASAMGQRYAQTKPKKQDKGRKKQKSSLANIQFKGGSIFNQKFDETLLYRPKTQENKIRYDLFLGKVNSVAEDYPQQTLMSLAD